MGSWSRMNPRFIIERRHIGDDRDLPSSPTMCHEPAFKIVHGRLIGENPPKDLQARIDVIGVDIRNERPAQHLRL